jgi:hypothetical protein
MRIAALTFNRSLILSMVALLCGVTACTTRPTFLSNADPALRKTSAQFSADAAHRNYEADAPKGGLANGGAEVDYGIHRLSIVNSSSEDWKDVEIWLNKKYVILVPVVPAQAAHVEMLEFKTIYDQNGNSFPLDSAVTPIETVEMYKDGKMYSLGQPRLAD